MPAIYAHNKAEEGIFLKANTANKLEFKIQAGFLPSQPSHCLVFWPICTFNQIWATHACFKECQISNIIQVLLTAMQKLYKIIWNSNEVGLPHRHSIHLYLISIEVLVIERKFPLQQTEGEVLIQIYVFHELLLLYRQSCCWWPSPLPIFLC